MSVYIFYSEYVKGLVIIDDKLFKEFVFSYFMKYFIMLYGSSCNEFVVGFLNGIVNGV